MVITPVKMSFPKINELCPIGAGIKNQGVRQNRIVKQALNGLYQERHETGDVRFIVDSEIICAHRCVLATLSPKYKAQFFGLKRDDGDIEVEDVTAAAFEEFLQFFYLDEIVLTIENIENVINLAQQSLVDDFTNECIDFLKEIVANKNACTIYRLALLFDNKELIHICEHHISGNVPELFGEEDFINSDRDILMKILKMDSLNCRELEVFDACIQWARAACEQKNIDAENMVNLRAELSEGIGEIRFCSMKIEEFAVQHRKYKGFFTTDESDEIIYMIGKLEDFKSEKFNQRPRNQSTSLKSQIHYECFRILPKMVETFILHGIESIGINFLCNKGIRLKGFAASINIPIVENALYVGVKSLLGTNEYFLQYEAVANEEGYALMFHKPVNIRQEDGVVEIRMEVVFNGLCKSYQLSKHWNCSINENPSDDFIFNFYDGGGAIDVVTRLFFSPLD